MIRIQFCGTCRVSNAAGHDLTPRAAKEQALLLLLCDARNHRCARRWIEATLWSDKPTRKAAGSLRQALLNIRSALADDAPVLGSDRHHVWLDPAAVVTDLEQQGGEELLQGIDVGDEAFEDWLRERRAQDPVAAPRVSKPAIGLSPPEDGVGVDWVISRALGQRVAEDTASLMGAMCIADQGRGKRDVTIDCNVATDATGHVASLGFVDANTGQLIYATDVRFGPSSSASGSLGAVSHMIALAAHQRMAQTYAAGNGPMRASGLVAEARDHMAQFSSQSQTRADALLTEACDIAPDGLFFAYRALNMLARVIDSRETDTDALLEHTRMLLSKALEIAGSNPHTRAIAALAQLMMPDDDDPAKAAALLPLTQHSDTVTAKIGQALLTSWHGDHARALRLSRSCLRAVSNDTLKPIWHLYHSLICIAAGQPREAIIYAESAARGRPDFRAPQRQLIGLRAAAGDLDGALSAFATLQRVEPDLSMDSLLHDPDYPVTTLRRAGYLDQLAMEPLIQP